MLLIKEPGINTLKFFNYAIANKLSPFVVDNMPSKYPNIEIIMHCSVFKRVHAILKSHKQYLFFRRGMPKRGMISIKLVPSKNNISILVKRITFNVHGGVKNRSLVYENQLINFERRSNNPLWLSYAFMFNKNPDVYKVFTTLFKHGDLVHY